MVSVGRVVVRVMILVVISVIVGSVSEVVIVERVQIPNPRAKPGEQ
jgi:hypothetical protein